MVDKYLNTSYYPINKMRLKNFEAGGFRTNLSTRIPEPTEIISVVYSYDWIPGFNDTDLETSREFCVDLRTESINGMTWAREDIEDIATAGYPDSWGGDVDIWAMRGGWYNRNGTPVPHCRHQWVQLVIREQV